MDNGTDDLAATTLELRDKLTDVRNSELAQASIIDASKAQFRMRVPRIPYLPRPSRLYEYVRSRSRTLDIELETVQSVLEYYGLELTSPPSNLPLSRRTRNVTVETPAGRLVLKRYRSRFGTAAVIYVHSVLNHLAQVNFPATRLIPAPDGETFISHGGSNYAMSEFVAGTNYSVSFVLPAHRRMLMRMTGETLARLHLTLEGFVPEGQHHLGFTSYSGTWRRDLLWYAGRVEELRARSRDLADGHDRSYADWMAQNSGQVLDELAQLDDALRDAALPRQIIHGDYGLHNIVLQRDGVVTPLDFELSRLEWRLTDLVLTLSRLRSANGEYDLEGIRNFLRGYQDVYPIGEDEWQFLPLVWRFHKLRASLISWNSYFEAGGPVGKLIAARAAVHQANWALLHSDKLLEFNTFNSL